MRKASHILHESEEPVLWPTHYLSGSGATYDVIVFETEARRQALEFKAQRGESSSSSPSAAAVAAAASAGAVFHCVPMLTEDEQVLKQQIERYLAGKKTTLLPPEE